MGSRFISTSALLRSLATPRPCPVLLIISPRTPFPIPCDILFPRKERNLLDSSSTIAFDPTIREHRVVGYPNGWYT